MERTFRLNRLHLYTMAAGLMLWTLMAGLGVSLTLEKPEHWVVGLLVFLLPFFFMAGFCIWNLFAYFRHALIVVDGLVRSVGVFSDRVIALPQVKEARWRTWPAGGSLVLRTENARIVIEFASYEQEAPRQLVRFFRSAIDPAKQTGWNLFAYKVTDGSPPRTEPNENETLLTRRRWDYYLLPTILISALVGILSWRFTGQTRMALGFVITRPASGVYAHDGAAP
jgi:hypothetical protein